MPIFRVHKNKIHPYTVIDNTSINDTRLSAKAKGILLYLISKPDHWFTNLPNLINAFTDGEKSIRSGITELIKFGYIVRSHVRQDNGRFLFYDYAVFEKPFKISPIETITKPERPFPVLDNPVLDNPVLDNPVLDNGTLVSTNNKESTDNNNTPVAVESASLKKKKVVIKLLEELNIKNYTVFFKLFPLNKIFDYSNWILSKNFTMQNPTGFLIAAIKENWMDYDIKESNTKVINQDHYCSKCNKPYFYMKGCPRPDLCLLCFHKSKKQKV